MCVLMVEAEPAGNPKNVVCEDNSTLLQEHLLMLGRSMWQRMGNFASGKTNSDISISFSLSLHIFIGSSYDLTVNREPKLR